MAKHQKFGVSLPEDVVRILDAVAARKTGGNRSKLLQHLILYQGLCGGDMPLTRKILDLPEADRDRVVAEILERAVSDDPPKPQSFALWVKETIGNSDKESLEAGANSLLSDLLSRRDR